MFMKDIGKILFILFISILGITNVHASASDEYAIIFKTTGEITIYTERKDDSHIYTGDTSGIYSYDSTSKVMTLKEGVRYIGVYFEETGGHTITSNNKKVYLNMMYGDVLTVENLNSESFVQSNDYVWDTYNENDDTTPMMTHIHSGDLSIKDSTVIIKDERYTYDGIIHTVYDSNNPTSTNITIENSTVKTTNVLLSDKANITIKDNSIVKSAGLGCLNPSTNLETLLIKDSTVETSFNDIRSINNYMTYGFVFDPVITIEDSNITTNAFWRANAISLSSTNIFVTDDLENFDLLGIQTGSLTLNNSSIDISGSIISNIINLTNSTLYSKTGPNQLAIEKLGNDGSTMSALVTPSLTLVNSDFKATSNGDVPAVAIGSLTTDKTNFVLYDKDYNFLDFEEVTLDDYGFYVNPNNYSYQYNQANISPLMTNAKTGLLNNKASKTVYSGEKIEMTIRVVNGTWEDGTTDAKTVTVISGFIPTKEMFKTKPLKNNQELIIERTGDNEYSYIYIDTVNPKTGVGSITLVLVIAILSMLGLTYYKDDLSLFRRL